MTIRRVQGLGTFPAVKPVHGGQRRAAAFRTFYQTIGIDYVYTCIYDSTHYAPPLVGPHDIQLDPSVSADAPVSLIGDYLSGRQGASDNASFKHFLNLAELLKPDALQLEQPFMWPLAQRLREALGAEHLPLIYSSYNVEAPLKDAILSGHGVAPEVRRRICHMIEEMEAEICRQAALVVCVTASERDHYLRYCAPENVIVVPNGVDRPPPLIHDYSPCLEVFGARPFVFMVGSAYGPNIEGLCKYVFRDGAFMVPPVKSIALCGGVGEGVLNHPLYQRFLEANSRRVHFFPKIEDSELWAVKSACHVVALPIDTGGGSNLKTAEALTLGKRVIASTVAMRGYASFLNAEGLVIANDSVAFRRAIAQTLRSPPLVISDESRKAREALYWDRCFNDSDLKRRLSVLSSSHASIGQTAKRRMIASKTISIVGSPATVFGYEEDDYYRAAEVHAANNPMLSRALASLPAESIIIDAGANIGLTAISASREAPQSRLIVAVEPSPKALACLRQAVSANSLAERITIVPKALSSASGSLRFAEHEFLAGSHLIDGETPFDAEVVVPVTTMDALAEELKLTRIDLIKLDLEGHELDALKGAEKVIARFKPTFVAEFNSFATCAYRRQSPILLLEFLLQRFGSFTYLHDGTPRRISGHREAIDFMYRNMAFSIVDDLLFGGASNS